MDAAVEAMYGELLAGPKGAPPRARGAATAAALPQGAAKLGAGIRDLCASYVAYVHQAHQGLAKVWPWAASWEAAPNGPCLRHGSGAAGLGCQTGCHAWLPGSRLMSWR